ncbi:MAG TPA: hypothetical protein VHR45_03940 [Thermoanaerobaculia bacterium]|nr:hypothetical protein [Thermoanaerobaculia bacterium]
MRHRSRITITLLLTGACALAALAATLAPAPLHAQADLSIAHIDGYLTESPPSPDRGRPCLYLRQHDGIVYSLHGRAAVGLQRDDHVRLEGRFAPDPRCGGNGFEVTKVQAVWADDNHQSTYYDHLHDAPFREWVGQYRPEALARERFRHYDRPYGPRPYPPPGPPRG